MKFRLSALSLALCAGVVSTMSVASEAYPNKPVKMVVPYPPGGPYDNIARVVSQKLSENFGKPFIVENRPGAGGMIGADAVAKADPDGYTLLVGGIGPNAINTSLYSKVTYDAQKDFTPVVEVLRSSNILVVNPNVKANNLQELIQLAKSGDHKLDYASAGAGSSPHMFAELFKQALKIDMVHVPYRGDAPAVMAVLGGEVPMYFASAASITPHINSGRLRALAVTGDERLPSLPNVPTIGEVGVPNYSAAAWYGVFAPANTPPQVVSLLNTRINAILEDPEVRRVLTQEGVAHIAGGSAEQFAGRVQAEIVKWKGVITSGNITAE